MGGLGLWERVGSVTVSVRALVCVSNTRACVGAWSEEAGVGGTSSCPAGVDEMRLFGGDDHMQEHRRTAVSGVRKLSMLQHDARYGSLHTHVAYHTSRVRSAPPTTSPLGMCMVLRKASISGGHSCISASISGMRLE